MTEQKRGRKRIGQPKSLTFTDEQCAWLDSKIPPGGTLTAVVRALVQAAMDKETPRLEKTVKK